jgi:hypothetical protein
LFKRTQSTRIGNLISSPLPITQSIIQGSGFGPVLYIIFKCCLTTWSNKNQLCLYADDATLLAPENTDIGIADEFQNVLQWADKNKLIINKSKTKQLIFRRPNLNLNQMPTYIPNIDVVDCVKLLGVFFGRVFNQMVHANFISGAANQSGYICLRF